MVESILRDQNSDTNKPLARALGDAGFVVDGRPHVAAVRIPMESEYRDFWELPYDEAVRTKLAFWLVQARAMLGLIRGLTARGTRALDQIRFIPRADFETQVEQIGGLDAEGVRRRALEVERAIYSVGSGLVPPSLEELPYEATAPYAPFDVIQAVEIDWDGQPLELRPLAMLDDIHDLHHAQLEALFRTLSHREMRFGRWMMMRLDALSPGAVLRSPDSQPGHNRTQGRDFLDIHMQLDSDKGAARKKFRRMALGMADLYLPMIPTFRNRPPPLRSLLSGAAPKLTDAQLRDLRETTDKDQRRLEITDERRASIDELVAGYAKKGAVGDDVAVAMSRILLHRYDKRRANVTPSLFGDDDDPDPRNPLKADAGVAHGARVHLHHQFGRPFHFGADDVCDASNENAEVFLGFAGALVGEVETRAVRRKPLELDAKVQQAVLRDEAERIIREWAFPQATRVRALVRAIGRACVDRTLEPNAPLDAGANAIGILEEEFKMLPSDDPILLVLKHAVASGAVTIERDYGQGGKLWCLIELTGTVALAFGLTFVRGGFIPTKESFFREALADA
ncbi:hypothetical protein [Oceanicola sp. 22II-s10i]|uniref:hypothetical protein n=1 Tax=Oceanicola sp. 22II-s10i TaxID=1317116 RepID=UPI001C3D50EE|nr:hypothetical protein [Oceanicola sp. 22II-s10i]